MGQPKKYTLTLKSEPVKDTIFCSETGAKEIYPDPETKTKKNPLSLSLEPVKETP